MRRQLRAHHSQRYSHHGYLRHPMDAFAAVDERQVTPCRASVSFDAMKPSTTDRPAGR